MKKQNKHKICRIRRRLYIDNMLGMLGKKRRYTNIWGKLHAFRFRFSLNIFLVFEVIAAVFSLTTIILNYAAKDETNYYLIAAFVVTIATFFLAQIPKWMQIKREMRLLIEIPNEQSEEIRHLPLPQKYVDSGYKYYTFECGANGVRYIMSHQINSLLNLSVLEFDYVRTKFVVPKKLRPFIPFSFKAYLSGEKAVFNGRKLKQLSDIYLDTVRMRAQKTDFFTNLATNEIVYKKIKNCSTLEKPFYGTDLCKANEDGHDILCSLAESPCANMIGVDTLALTSDGYLIVNRQGGKSFEAHGKFVPSGSGSVEKISRKKGLTFNALVCSEMERELREELALPQDTQILTEIIGYARLVEKGGKADFFGLSYVGMTLDQIKEGLLYSREIQKGLMGEPEFINIRGLNFAAAYKKFEDFVSVNKSTCSVQMDITRQSLSGFVHEGRDLFAELKNRFEKAAHVTVYTNKGIGTVNEDAYGSCGDFFWVLDGATPLGSKQTVYASDAAYLTQRWNARMLAAVIAADDELQSIIRTVHNSVAADYGDHPTAPSMSAAFAKIVGTAAQIAVYGDVRALILCSDGTTHELVSSIIQESDQKVLDGAVALAKSRGITLGEAVQSNQIKNILTLKRLSCDRDSITLDRSLPAAELHTYQNVERILLMTDGFYNHGNLQSSAHTLAVLHNKAALIRYYTRLKKRLNKDLTLNRYPRFKLRDDATAMLINIKKL